MYGNSSNIFTMIRAGIYTNASPDCNKGANFDLSRLCTRQPIDGSLHSQSELPKASDSALHSTWNPIGRLLIAWPQGISLVIVGLLVRHETTPALSA